MTMKTDNCTGPTLVTFALSPIFKAVNIAMKNRNTWYQRYVFHIFHYCSEHYDSFIFVVLHVGLKTFIRLHG